MIGTSRSPRSRIDDQDAVWYRAQSKPYGVGPSGPHPDLRLSAPETVSPGQDHPLAGGHPRDPEPAARVRHGSQVRSQDGHAGVRQRLAAQRIPRPAHDRASRVGRRGERRARNDGKCEHHRPHERRLVPEPRRDGPDARRTPRRGRGVSPAIRRRPRQGVQRRRWAVPARLIHGHTRRSTDGSARSAPRMKTLSGRTAGSQ